MNIDYKTGIEAKRIKYHKQITRILNKSNLTNNQRETLNQFYNTLRLGKKINFVKDLKRTNKNLQVILHFILILKL